LKKIVLNLVAITTLTTSLNATCSPKERAYTLGYNGAADIDGSMKAVTISVIHNGLCPAISQTYMAAQTKNKKYTLSPDTIYGECVNGALARVNYQTPSKLFKENCDKTFVGEY